jgi:hypothetical protein
MGHTSDTLLELKRLSERDEATVPLARVWTATGQEPQVFLDHTGRRARRMRVLGGLAALTAAGWLGGVIGGSAGFASLPALHSHSIVAHARAPVSRHARSHHRRTHDVEVAAVASTHG